MRLSRLLPRHASVDAGSHRRDAAYLEWLSKQDPQALVDLYDLGEVMKKSGIDIPEPDYKIPPGGLVSAEIKSKIDQIEHGFTEFAEVERAAKAAPDAKQIQDNAAAKAKELSDHIKKVLDSGVKMEKSTAPEREGPGTDKPAEFEAGDVENIADRPKPNERQLAEARSLFRATAAKAGSSASSTRNTWWADTVGCHKISSASCWRSVTR